MSELDKALEIFHQDVEDQKNQAQFYDLFLNSPLYIPIHEQKVQEDEQKEADGDSLVPLVVEADGNDYLMLFDSEERLKEWAEESAQFMVLPGHQIAEMTPQGLFWALNVGTEHQKQFVPDEIDWLKDVVKRCNEAAEMESQE